MKALAQLLIGCTLSLALSSCHRSPVSTHDTQVERTQTVASLATVASASAVDAKRPLTASDDERFIILNETEALAVVDPIGANLANAVDAFDAKNNAAASAALEAAAREVEHEEPGMNPPTLKLLSETATDLRKAAALVAQGKLERQTLQDAVSAAYAADVSQRLVFEDEALLVPYFTKPAIHLNAAQSMLKTDPKGAATQLAMVASYLQIQAARSDEQSRSRLFDAIKDLSTMAKTLSAGKSVSQSDFDDLRYEVSHELAYFHYHQALDAWKHAKLERAKQELSASLAHSQPAASDKAQLSADQQRQYDELLAWSKQEDVVVRADLQALEQRLAVLGKLLESERTEQSHSHATKGVN